MIYSSSSYYLNSLKDQHINNGMNYSEANKLIYQIRELNETLCKEIANVRKDFAQNNHDRELNKAIEFIRPWLLAGTYNIELVNTSSSIRLTEEGKAKLIVAIRSFIEQSETLPIGIQVNSALIKCVHGISYDGDKNIVTISLTYC